MERRVLFWVNVALLAAGVVMLGVGALLALEEPSRNPSGLSILLMVLGGLFLVVLTLTGPVAAWGAPGLLLTFGAAVTVGGAIAWAVGSVGAETVEALNEDNDGDGRLNEDPPGDADRSASDPTQIDGLAEAQNHADDDGDGLVDEDPAEPGGAREVASRVASIGRWTTLAGAAMLLGFGVLLWNRSVDRPSGGA